MKKILLILICLVMLMPLSINGLENDSVIDYTVDNNVFAHKLQNGEEKVGKLAFLTANGKNAYCIEPGVLADKGGVYSSTYDINDTYLTSEKYNYLSLLGYYGYDYNNHDKKEYYMATQELIWEYLGVDDAWWTDSKEGGNKYDIEKYKQEILELVNNYEKSPLFDLDKDYIIGTEVILEDKNNLLNEYELDKEYENIKLDNNKIIIKIKEGMNNFYLKRKIDTNRNIFYYKNGYQTIGTFETTYDFSKEYIINGIYGEISLLKEENNKSNKVYDNKEITLENALYGLYGEDNNLISKKYTNEEGKILFDNLVSGKYYIKEIKPSMGYILDDNIYTIVIDNNNRNKSIISKEDLITNNIVITKVYDDLTSGVMTPEENIEFLLYDEYGNIINSYITDINGKINLKLSYGKYLLKQVTDQDGIEKVEDKLIEVKENNKIQEITLINKKQITNEAIINDTVLPKTSKSISFIPLILSQIVSFIMVIYEKIFNKNNLYN